MVTILDLSNIEGDGMSQVKELARKYQQMNHENVLNFIKPFEIAPANNDHGMIVFFTEAPDHKYSWKTFCKLPFDLE
jgi:serine/threonine protein kinase